MDKFNFTPGPWRIVPTNSGLYIAGSVPGYFCEMRDCSSTYHVADNARAIAALPDLVAALECLLAESLAMNAELRHIGKGRHEDGAHPDCAIEQARAALAKVRGE